MLVLGILEALARERHGSLATSPPRSTASRSRSPPPAARRAGGGHGRAGARARRDLRHRPALPVPGRADPDVHGRGTSCACGWRCSATAAGIAYVIVDFSSGRIEEIAQAGAQSGFYLLAWGAGRGAARPRGAPRGRGAPRRARRARTRGAGARRGRRGARADRARAARRRRPQRLGDGPAGGRRAPAARRRARARARREALAASRRPAARRCTSCTACSASCACATTAPSWPRRRRCAASASSSTRSAPPAWRRGLTITGEPGRARARAGHVRLPDRAGGADQRAALRARLDRRRRPSATAATSGSRCATAARA